MRPSLRFDNPAHTTYFASVADPAFDVPTQLELLDLKAELDATPAPSAEALAASPEAGRAHAEAAAAFAVGERKRTLLSTYAQSRSLTDLAAVPLRANEKPVLWRVRPLGAEQRALVNSNRLVASADLDAVRYGVVARIEGASITPDGTVTGGAETKLALTPGARLVTVTDEAIDAEVSIAGGTWVDEMGAAIRHRSDQHPRRCLPFLLPQRVAALL